MIGEKAEGVDANMMHDPTHYERFKELVTRFRLSVANMDEFALQIADASYLVMAVTTQIWAMVKPHFNGPRRAGCMLLVGTDAQCRRPNARIQTNNGYYRMTTHVLVRRPTRTTKTL